MTQQDMLTTTPDALRDAIEQSVRGWVMTQDEYKKGVCHPLMVEAKIKDLTQHLFGNVVMALRFAPDVKASAPDQSKCNTSKHGTLNHTVCDQCKPHTPNTGICDDVDCVPLTTVQGQWIHG